MIGFVKTAFQVSAIGAAMRFALHRAGPAPAQVGTILQPGPQGITAGGGWRERNGVPEAGQIERGAAMAIGTALGLGLLTWAASRRRRG